MFLNKRLPKFNYLFDNKEMIVYFFVLINLILRFPSINNSIPPYFFYCDEGMFIQEVVRMIQDNSFQQNMFKAGPVNIYPPFIIYKLYSLVFNSSFDYLELLFIGRLVLPIASSAITILYLDKLIRLLILNKKNLPSFTALSLFTFSPYIFSQTRIWYPDNYQFLFSTMFMYHLLKLNRGEYNLKNTLPVIISFTLLTSVKYTGLLYLLPLLVVILIKNYELIYEIKISQIIKKNLSYLFFGLIFISAFNLSAILNFENFMSDYLFNFQNYGGNYIFQMRAFHGFKYYAVFLFIIPTSIFSVTFLFYGIKAMFGERKFFDLFLIFVFPLGVCIYLGGFYLIMNRNINFLFINTIVIVTYGIVKAMENLENRFNSFWKFNLFALVAFILFSFSFTFISDFKTDSRIEASQWLDENIIFKADTLTFGHNEGCTGDSPAENKFLIFYDPEMIGQHDFYLFNNYWKNPVLERGKINVLTQTNFKNAHFYYYMNLNLLTNNILKETLSIPEGYQLVKTFTGNGPDLYLLQKVYEND